MRVCLVLAALLSGARLIAGHEGHQCVHDAMVHRAKDHWRGVGVPDPFELRAEALSPHSDDILLNGRRLQSYSSIRIQIMTDKLQDGADRPYVCEGTAGNPGTFVEGSGQSTSFSSTFPCTANDVMHVGDDKYNFLMNHILQDALDYFKHALSVIPVTTTLSWTAPQTWNNFTCFNSGRILPYICCDAVLPSSGRTGVGGITNADYVLYVTKRPTIGSVLAWALPCFSDTRQSSLNRPIMGQANFSPAQISLTPSAYAQQLSTAIHEISHALGFTSSKFAQFINPVTGATLPYSSVVFQGYDSSLQKTVSKIITPSVVQKIKEHFGCSNWPNAGAELEDYGGSGTAGSHWEKRIYFNEYMTGTADPNSVYSAMTLALFQDSGWYQVNYTMAQSLPWGNNAGCSFATQQCSAATWGTQFCTTSNQEGCSADMRYRSVCNLYSFGSALPSSYQYFPNPNQGGSMPYADYCPYYQRYSNGDCWDTTTTGYFGYGEAASPGGPTARCFAGTFLLSAFGVTPPRHSACLNYVCNAQSLVVVKLIGQSNAITNVVCPIEGGDVDVATIPGSQFRGVLTCPPQSLLCTGNPCDNQFCSGHGVCSPSTGTCTCNTRWYGSDAFTCNLQTCATNATGAQCSETRTCNPLTAPAGTCRGQCNANTGTCTCAAGYTGTACEAIGCPTANGLQCNGQGNCTIDGVCQCFSGYIGSSCSVQDCPGSPRCGGSSQGTCDTNIGVCTCSDVIVPGDAASSTYFTGVACAASNTGLRPYTELGYAGETVNNVVIQPTTVTLQPKEWSYFTFTAASAAYKISAKLTPQSAVTLSQLSFVAAYSDVFPIPSLQSQQFASIVQNQSVNYRIISFNPPTTINGVIQQSTFNRAGTINLAVLSTASTPVSVQIALTRDGCAVLNCTHGGVCANGVCSCPRFVTTDGKSYGWSGDDCSDADCPGTPHCGGRGLCVISNTTHLPTCECTRYYNGSACQNSISGANTFVYPGDSSTLVTPGDPAAYSIENSLGFSTKSGVALIGKTVRWNVAVRDSHVASFRFDAPMAAVIRVEVTGTPDADPILMGRSNQPPTLSQYDSFDVSAWTSGGDSHVYAAIIPSGDYYVAVMNSRYGLTPLNFTLYYEFATLCPPSLTDSSNITAPALYPLAPSQPCSGHGDPQSYCSNPNPAAIPPATPVLCVCQSGWEGVYCEIPVTTLTPDTPQALTGIPPGGWQYLAYVASSSTVELQIQAVRTSVSLRSQPLVVVGRVSSRSSQSLASLFDSAVLFDFDGYTSFSGNQTVRVSRSNSLSARPASEFFYIGVHNTKSAKAALDMTVTLSALSQFSARCPAAAGAQNQADCLSESAVSVCARRGIAMTTAEDADAVDCQCDVGWNRRTWCSSPLVFQSFGEFLTATQNIAFLCNVCHEEFNATQHSVAFYRIPQPLQKATGLEIETHQPTSAANPSLMVAQNLPRSIADFVFVASSTNLSQTIQIDSASATGSYWVSVYANNAGYFNLTSNRANLGGNITENQVFIAQLGNWLVQSSVGIGTLAMCLAVFACVFLGCCSQYIDCSRKKTGKATAPTRPSSTDSDGSIVKRISSARMGMFDPTAPELRRNSSRNMVIDPRTGAAMPRHSSRNVFAQQRVSTASHRSLPTGYDAASGGIEMGPASGDHSAIFRSPLQSQRSATRTSLRGVSASNLSPPPPAVYASPQQAAEYYAMEQPQEPYAVVYQMPDGSYAPPPPAPNAAGGGYGDSANPGYSEITSYRPPSTLQSRLKATKFAGTAASLFTQQPHIPPPPSI